MSGASIRNFTASLLSCIASLFATGRKVASDFEVVAALTFNQRTLCIVHRFNTMSTEEMVFPSPLYPFSSCLFLHVPEVVLDPFPHQ